MKRYFSVFLAHFSDCSHPASEAPHFPSTPKALLFSGLDKPHPYSFHIMLEIMFSSVQSLSRVRLFVTPWIAARQASLSITNSRVHSDSRPLSPWCHPAISSSVVPFSSCPQSLPASESFPMSQLFAWGGQRTRASALESFLPKESQGWSPSEWTGWISFQSKGLSSLLQHHSSKASVLRRSAFFTVQLSHP